MTTRVQKGGFSFKPVAKTRRSGTNPPSQSPAPGSGGKDHTPTKTVQLSSEDPEPVPPEPRQFVNVEISSLREIQTPFVKSSTSEGLSFQTNSIATISNAALDNSRSANPIPRDILVETGTPTGPSAPIESNSDFPAVQTTHSNRDLEANFQGIETDETEFAPYSGTPSSFHQIINKPSPYSDKRTENEPAGQAVVTTQPSIVVPGSSLAARKRKRALITVRSDDEEQLPERSRTKRRTRDSSEPRPPRKGRASKSQVFDADADPGEEIDPTVVKMSDICDDLGHGRVSSKATMIQANHLAWKTQNKEKRARMKMAMELRKFGKDNDADEVLVGGTVPTETGEQANSQPEQESPSNLSLSNNPPIEEGSSRELSPAAADDSGQGFDYSQTFQASGRSAQVRLGPGGVTIVDDQSTEIDLAAGEDDTAGYTHVIESDNTKFTNSSSYGRKVRGGKWSAEETELFYDALAQFGENYELISYMLPGRTRNACKTKFKSEDKKNPHRIDHTLKYGIPIDMQTLSARTGKDFSGPTPEIRTPTPKAPQQPPAAPRSPTASRASAPPQQKPRKRGKKGQEEGVQVLGSIEDYEDDVPEE